MASSLKHHISSPLETGVPVAEGHQLPSRVTMALEYASSRLSRKAAHVTLLAVQRDYQLPVSTSYPSASAPPAAISPAVATPRPAFAASTITSLRQLIRSNNTPDAPIRERIVHVGVDSLRHGAISPAFSDVSATSASSAFTASSSDSIFSNINNNNNNSKQQWPASPSCPSLPLTPATPFTIASSTTDTSSALSSPSFQYDTTQFTTRLVLARPLTPGDDRLLHQTLSKAARKFKLPPTTLAPSLLTLPTPLITRSLAQNDTLFSSESITILSLDHVYTFRTALQSYARTKSPCRLEDAVDELRRLFLANGRRALGRRELLSEYRWLDPVEKGTLRDVRGMYRRAYGEDVVENVEEGEEWPLRIDGEETGWSLMEVVVVDGRDREMSEVRDRRETPRARTPPPRPLSLSITPKPPKTAPHRWSMGEEKEIFEGLMGLSMEAEVEELEIDAIEAWYREVQVPQTVNILPDNQVTTTVEVLPKDIRETTPKLAVSPPRRTLNLALRLQTTFEKPKPRPILQHHPNQSTQIQTPTSESAGDLTARPVSAIISHLPSNAGWNNPMSASIDGVLLDSSITAITKPVAEREKIRHPLPGGLHDLVLSPISPTSPQGQRVGPLTPNGYDDISPITRNEWGFLTRTLPKIGGVEMC